MRGRRQRESSVGTHVIKFALFPNPRATPVDLWPSDATRCPARNYLRRPSTLYNVRYNTYNTTHRTHRTHASAAAVSFVRLILIMLNHYDPAAKASATVVATRWGMPSTWAHDDVSVRSLLLRWVLCTNNIRVIIVIVYTVCVFYDYLLVGNQNGCEM